MSYQVEFRKSGKTLEWNDHFISILEFAEGNGLKPDHQCRMGNCGTCKTRLLSGEVHMVNKRGLEEWDIAKGYILICVAVPKSDIVLDA